jgi:Ni2+-binding GTPase involved in maturation of urease and hydrogenase
MKNKMKDDGIIERNGDLLVINKSELIEMIKNNCDKSSATIDSTLITMINCFYGRMSVKQLNWIVGKVLYIIRHNKEYSEYKGIKDIQFI